MTEINRAYKLLSNPVARSEYDRLLSSQQIIRSSAQTTAPLRKSEGHPDEATATGWAQEKTSSPKVRIQNKDGRFIAYDNGTVLDTNSNLMWAANDSGNILIKWADAKSYCDNYRGGGYADWRMPTLNELAGLYDMAITYQAAECRFLGFLIKGEVHITELIHLTSVGQWAAEKRGSKAAYFNFGNGKLGWYPPVGRLHRPPCRPGTFWQIGHFIEP
jgi:curved DNA-binding protein CbpA